MIEATCVLDARARTGENPVWDERRQRLWWVDIPAGKLHCFDPETGGNATWSLPSPCGCFAPTTRGDLIVALVEGFHRFDPETGELTPIHDPEPERAGNRFNDGTTDPRGRFLASTMPMGGVVEGEPASGSLYALSPDLACATLLGPSIFVANGLAFSPDGRTMHLADTARWVRTIWAFDYDLDSGALSRRRLFFDTRTVAGRPDGAAVDEAGCYWFAGVGGWQLYRVTPDGRLDRTIDLPVERPSKPCFGGSDLRTMYVTSIADGITPGTADRQPQAGGLFALDVGVKGLAPVRFGG